MKNQKLHNPEETLKFRKELRNNLTPAEAFLWSHLKRKQLEGRKFRRQHGIGPFIGIFTVHQSS
jgi:very-short-patch-repair endonuclease